MANSKLTRHDHGHIIQTATELMKRRRALIERDFPLSRDDIQDAILPTEERVAINALFAVNPNWERVVRPVGLFDADTPTVRIVLCADPKLIAVSAGNIVDLLPPAWVARAEREMQLQKIVLGVLDTILVTYCPTAYHAKCRWPVLAMLANDHQLRVRMSEQPKLPKAYGWDKVVLSEKLRAGMALAEMMLMQASMLAEPDRNAVGPLAVTIRSR